MKTYISGMKVRPRLFFSQTCLFILIILRVILRRASWYLSCYFLPDVCPNSLPASPHSLTSLTSCAHCCPFPSHTSFLPSPCSTHCSQQPWLLAVWLSFLHEGQFALQRWEWGRGVKGRERVGEGKKRTRNKYVGCQRAIHIPSLPSPTQNPAQNNFFTFGKRKGSPE